MAENEQNKLTVDVRTSFGKGAARKIRALGKIPAVIYGHGTEPQHVTLPGHETALIIRRANALIELDIEGKDQTVLVKDVQRDPVRQIIEHMDLVIIRRGEKVQVEIPVHVEGESAPGTVANLDTTTLLLEVPAVSIPQNIVVSIEGLEDGAQVTAGDITLPEGAVLVSEPDLLILAIYTPQEESDDTDTEATDAPAEESSDSDE
ncbi:50S ribosomal protein L25/general stress protein Ctc [Amnibacterium flavum]|uniref:Large ribosomal subunit protein bL25 n=1 Tax=Amnibacterium flavum TaxID=2173173 RepID=A0A2V1HRE1_9MICO|nr:50S ribosomal protein L25/general stress protein Ctc [Amnibacterium flavum]PVZ93679.1 50S ribosomal protein L25 [Amnibacterium flavum]